MDPSHTSEAPDGALEENEGAPEGESHYSAQGERAGSRSPRGSARTHRKVFDYTLTIPNPVHFCANKAGHTLGMLQAQLVGKNFKGARIVRIDSVLAMSAVHIQRTNGSGGGYMDVRVLAETEVFAKWDILVGVRILYNKPIVLGVYAPRGGTERLGEAAAGAATAVVTLAATEITRTLAQDQLVAVRVIQASHPPMKQQVAIYGVPLSCDRAAPVYRLRGTLDKTAQAALGPLLSAIAEELAARQDLVAARRADLWFFESLLHPMRVTPGPPETDQAIPAWPGGPEWVGPLDPQGGPVHGAVSVLDVVRRAVVLGESVPVAGVWSRPLGLYRSSPLAVHLAAELGAPPEDWGPVVDGTAKAVFAEFLKNILDYLGAIRELPAVYGTPELIKQHTGLWEAMRRMQRP